MRFRIRTWPAPPSRGCLSGWSTDPTCATSRRRPRRQPRALLRRARRAAEGEREHKVSVADLGTIRTGVTLLLPRGPMESDRSGTATHGIRVALPPPERFSAGILCACRDSRRARHPDTLRTLPLVSIAGG